VKSQQVELSVLAMDLQGTTVTVRITRQDTINGQAHPPRQQTVRLSQRGGAWTIDSMGQ